jgi:hypothetical protein
VVRLVHLCVAQLYAVYYTHPLVLLAIRVVLQITENLNKKISILINVVRGTPPNNHFLQYSTLSITRKMVLCTKKNNSQLFPQKTLHKMFFNCQRAHGQN